MKDKTLALLLLFGVVVAMLIKWGVDTFFGQLWGPSEVALHLAISVLVGGFLYWLFKRPVG